MSPLDEGFRTRIAKVFDDWRASITLAFRVGQQKGIVRADVDPKDSAIFVIALYEGYLSLAKSSQDVRVLQAGKKAIANYLESLRLVPAN
jgi:hypothetical protein